jgi:hypothetical protein
MEKKPSFKSVPLEETECGKMAKEMTSTCGFTFQSGAGRAFISNQNLENKIIAWGHGVMSI